MASRREQEEKYFAEQEQRKRKALREKLDDQRESQKKEHVKSPHWMKCPKCGHNLVEMNYHDVLVDKCSHCHGFYLDAGELDLLLEGQKKKGFFTSFVESVGPGKG